MKVVLELQDQPSNVRRITVRHDIVIGRGSDCNLRLSAPQVSRRHCFLRVGRDSVSVTDLDSSNGTFVDGTRITAGKRYDITDGAQLALGPVRFVIHVRSDAGLSDNVKSKTAAGRAEAESDSTARRAMIEGSGTVTSRSRVADSDVPMDFNLEQGGHAAEPHEATEDNLDDEFSSSGLARIFAGEPDPADSRLEIIDFGRRLSEESLIADETCAVSPGDVVRESKTGEDEEPQWESTIVDSSDSSGELNLPASSDNSDILIGDQEIFECEVEENEEDTLQTSDEILEVADEVLEEDAESRWFEIDAEETIDEVVTRDHDLTIDPLKSSDDKHDPDLDKFLKGF